MSTPERSAARDETPAERSDRNWTDLLQEFRVLQTGVQILGGFLLTLPLHSAFADLDDFQRGLYLVLVLVATSSTALMLAPIAIHRRLFGWQRKYRLVRAGHVLMRIVMVMIGLLVAGIATFVFDLVTDRTTSLLVGAAMLAIVATALIILPLVLGGRRPEQE